MKHGERNPYPTYGLNGRQAGWRWKDENGRMHPELYPTETAALHAMLRHINRLPVLKRWLAKARLAWGKRR